MRALRAFFAGYYCKASVCTVIGDKGLNKLENWFYGVTVVP